MPLRRNLFTVLVGTACALGLVAGCGGTTSPTSDATAGATAATGATGATAGTSSSSARYPSGTQTISLDVKGTTRTALLVVPADRSHPAPLVFAFHGHGGSGQNFERKMGIEKLWPQAIVVYPNGVVGHKGKTDPDGTQTGWQSVPGEQGDSDLAFYDALLASLRAKLPVDRDRIYLMGHSNGSAFVSLVLNQRGGPIAATANLSGQPGKYLATDPVRSMFMAMGQSDPIVPYANQRKSVPLAEAKIGADPATATVDGYLRTEPGRGHLELAVYDYPGGHEPPPEIPPLIVSFFQGHTLSGG